MLYDLNMRSDTTTDGQKDRTFTETARRAQIVAAAIDAIAELGYAQASMARIAERLGITKGVIAYHFGSKDELIREIVAEVMTQAQEYMVPRITAETTGSGTLRTWIESNLAFMAEHRNHLVAVVEIARNARAADGRPLFDNSMLEAGAAALEQMLARFQAAGEFRADFDPQVMAGAIRAAIDAVPRALSRDPGLDVEHYGRELSTLFDVATRNPKSRSRKRGQ
jgi:TetR/AcrR family fatty acid metabolism transcriptional regulator